jgi:hypothetical protein
VLFDELGDFIQLMVAEITRSGERERSHPILCVGTAFRDVNVHWLTAIDAEKEKAISSKVRKNSGHALC